MILQALCDCYQMFSADKDAHIAKPGYSSVDCSYAAVIATNGELLTLISLIENKKGEGLIVPEQNGRTGIKPYFLCDNAKYFFGVEYDKKEKNFIPREEYLTASCEYHRTKIGNATDPGLMAVLAFFKDRSEGKSFDLPPDFQGGNIVFRLEKDLCYVHERPAVVAMCAETSEPGDDAVFGQCLITGEENVPLARIHAKIKGVAEANAAGCNIVSFKPKSFESYGKEQSYNAPVSDSAMFQYTTALNYLLSSKEHCRKLGEATVAFWASKKGTEERVMAAFLTDPATATATASVEENTELEQKIANLLLQVRTGKSITDVGDPDVQTFILGLSPNNSRASIRFWYTDTFLSFIERMADHQENMRVGNPNKPQKIVTIPQILGSITPESTKRSKKVPASYENALFRAIVTKGDYPMSVYTAILVRIRAEPGKVKEPGIDAVRVGYLKAVLLRNYHHEELTMSIDLSSTSSSYLLGNLFAVLEALQRSANKSTNIRARYFASASVNPKVAFPSLLTLAQHHIAKDADHGGYYDSRIEKILSKIVDFPPYLSLEEQGMFVLGYYHQREYLYMKKEDKEKLEA